MVFKSAAPTSDRLNERSRSLPTMSTSAARSCKGRRTKKTQKHKANKRRKSKKLRSKIQILHRSKASSTGHMDHVGATVEPQEVLIPPTPLPFVFSYPSPSSGLDYLFAVPPQESDTMRATLQRCPGNLISLSSRMRNNFSTHTEHLSSMIFDSPELSTEETFWQIPADQYYSVYFPPVYYSLEPFCTLTDPYTPDQLSQPIWHSAGKLANQDLLHDTRCLSSTESYKFKTPIRKKVSQATKRTYQYKGQERTVLRPQSHRHAGIADCNSETMKDAFLGSYRRTLASAIRRAGVKCRGRHKGDDYKYWLEDAADDYTHRQSISLRSIVLQSNRWPQRSSRRADDDETLCRLLGSIENNSTIIEDRNRSRFDIGSFIRRHIFPQNDQLDVENVVYLFEVHSISDQRIRKGLVFERSSVRGWNQRQKKRCTKLASPDIVLLDVVLPRDFQLLVFSGQWLVLSPSSSTYESDFPLLGHAHDEHSHSSIEHYFPSTFAKVVLGHNPTSPSITSTRSAVNGCYKQNQKSGTDAQKPKALLQSDIIAGNDTLNSRQERRLHRIRSEKAENACNSSLQPHTKQHVSNSTCPVDGHSMSSEHISIFGNCSVVESVWEELHKVNNCIKNQRGRSSCSTLIALQEVADRSLDKSASGDADGRLDSTWQPSAAVTMYRRLLRRRILKERASALQEVEAFESCRVSSFERLWGQPPDHVKAAPGPACLHRPQNIDESTPTTETMTTHNWEETKSLEVIKLCKLSTHNPFSELDISYCSDDNINGTPVSVVSSTKTKMPTYEPDYTPGTPSSETLDSEECTIHSQSSEEYVLNTSDKFGEEWSMCANVDDRDVETFEEFTRVSSETDSDVETPNQLLRVCSESDSLNWKLRWDDLKVKPRPRSESQ